MLFRLFYLIKKIIDLLVNIIQWNTIEYLCQKSVKKGIESRFHYKQEVIVPT